MRARVAIHSPEYAIGQRLARAYQMLTDPRFADRSITSVEFDAGFGALSQMLRRHAVRDPGGGTPAGGDSRVLGSVIQTKRSLTAPDFFSSRPFRRWPCPYWAKSSSPWAQDFLPYPAHWP